ncbi:MAG: nucleoside deaminase [Pelagibacteraceae bacterium]|jgi:tRNA(Arg) A34 adenosine deaminase TadA|nr:nucleoside deaminase [Pelagibacteraceae bacterium]MBO6490792.1 nucleoside deaminase [Pelagibacteraceae bacterium]MBO6491650.1 nucleoside deaminase [Pelagibacteraceae bacterium]MBO6492052.1 nucleoside deaminase [Pelagibacteraceae bacterium]MBO6492954.1 nucleoside deaminase [Pelagibacteraceae bacterium]
MKNEFMKRAIELSIESVNRGGGPFGSIIVKDNNIVAEGSNKVTLTNDPTAHGEIVAIREACKKLNNFSLNDCELYSTCEPCPMCLSAIYWARIDKIYYANTRKDAQKIDFDDSLIYSELQKNINKRKIPMIQMMRNEALVAFELWDKKTDKVEY